jgi:hypothetical protein
MYKYQCSKDDCGTKWIVREGTLNGFVLTCPICGKGRGLYVSQIKDGHDQPKEERKEEITIEVDVNSVKTTEELNLKINEFIKKHSLQVISKNVEAAGKSFLCNIQYKLKE